MSTIEEQIRAAERELSRLEEKFRSYDGGDRPMSPSAELMREEREARRWLEDLRAQRAAKGPVMPRELSTILRAAENLDKAAGQDDVALGREAAEALCAAIGGEAGRWLRKHLHPRGIGAAAVREADKLLTQAGFSRGTVAWRIEQMIAEMTRLRAERTPLDRATVQLAAMTRERLKSIGQLFGIAPNRIIDDISVGEALQRRERERYELGLRHGATLRGARAVAAGVPLDVLARALWNAVDRGETSFEDLAAEHAEDSDGSPLSIVRAEASSVRSAILDHLAAAEKRVEDVDASTAWGRLEALVKAGPVELRAAWRAWEIAREAEPATRPEASGSVARRPFAGDDARALLADARVDVHGAWLPEDVIAAIIRADREAFQAGQRHGAGRRELSPVADALTGMIERLGGDGVCERLNYDGDDKKIADGLFRFVQELEERARQEELFSLLGHLGAPKETLDRFRHGDWTAEQTKPLRETVCKMAKSQPPTAPPEPPPALRHAMRSLAAAIDESAQSLGAMLREPALIQGARRAVAELEQAWETHLSEHRSADLRYPAPMPGTEPEPGLELLPGDLSVRAAATPWTDLAAGPSGGKLIPDVARGEIVFFTGPDSGAWGAERAKDGSLTLMMPRAKVDLEARALLQRARIRLVEEPDSTKLHAEIDAFLAPQANAAAPEALRLAQALREAPDDLLLEIAPAIEAALDVVRARRSP